MSQPLGLEEPPLTVEAGSVAQEIAGAVPAAKVVKAFNTTFAGPLALAHQLEGVGYVNMAIQPGLGTNYGSALKVVAEPRSTLPCRSQTARAT
jgi:predicted dinucleotide-binding enzyme